MLLFSSLSVYIALKMMRTWVSERVSERERKWIAVFIFSYCILKFLLYSLSLEPCVVDVERNENWMKYLRRIHTNEKCQVLWFKSKFLSFLFFCPWKIHPMRDKIFHFINKIFHALKIVDKNRNQLDADLVTCDNLCKNHF